MLLTGKALEDFLKWVKKRCNIKIHELIKVEMWFVIQDYAFKNALIIEWLDSVGIFISINYVSFYDELRNDKGFEAYVTNNGLSVKFRSVKNRKEATKQAIIKANEIYNENRTN